MSKPVWSEFDEGLVRAPRKLRCPSCRKWIHKGQKCHFNGTTRRFYHRHHSRVRAASSREPSFTDGVIEIPNKGGKSKKVLPEDVEPGTYTPPPIPYGFKPSEARKISGGATAYASRPSE